MIGRQSFSILSQYWSTTLQLKRFQFRWAVEYDNGERIWSIQPQLKSQPEGLHVHMSPGEEEKSRLDKTTWFIIIPGMLKHNVI